MPKKLTPKQERFVDEYLVDLNATQAAIRAGYSVKTARQIGEENLSKPDIQAAIQARKVALQQSTHISAERVVKELARIAFGDKRRVVTWGPNGIEIVDSKDLSDDDAAMVSEVTEEDTKYGVRRKVKVHDKVKALELLGRHLGLFSDKVEVTGKGGGPLQSINSTVTPEQLAEAVKSVRDKF